PVVITDSPSGTWGFVANRVYGAMIQEANRCVDEGIATREQVDMLMVDCFRWPVGPCGRVRAATSGGGQYRPPAPPRVGHRSAAPACGSVASRGRRPAR